MDYVTDLHLHSRYSRAVSKDMTLPVIAEYARKKGFAILSTGDWTHPLWLREIKSQLTETNEGLFQLKSEILNSKSETNLNVQNTKRETHPLVPSQGGETPPPVYFLLSVEISSIYSQDGKVHRIHNLVLSPSFEVCEKVNHELLKRGCNLSSDGRPIIGISSRNLLELLLTIDERVMLIPAHIWTPWFSLYGANSGFDSLEACFGDMSPYVYGIETGLSSDPEMNWRIKDLESRSILSFSDAHSPAKMGREATVFRLESPSYANIREAIMEPGLKGTKPHPNPLLIGEGKQNVIARTKDEAILSQLSQTINIGIASLKDGPARNDEVNRVLYTVEFYPEEGKYHYNGHRNCNVIETPEETRRKGTVCPVCKRKLTVGVLQRVEDLTDNRVSGEVHANKLGLHWIKDPSGKHPPFVKLVPLNEIIAESYGMQVSAGKVKKMFDILCTHFENEMEVLLQASIDDIAQVSNARIAEGVRKVRAGDIVIRPGFDGEYGIVKIWSEKQASGTEKNRSSFAKDSQEKQLGIDF